MALTLEEKKAVVAEVHEIASIAYSAVVAEYRGLTVEEMTALRVSAQNANVYVRVVKNTLARKAVEGTEFECMQESFVGPLVLAFSREDLGSAARIFTEFAKQNEKLIIKALSVNGQLLDASQAETVAKLPTRDQAISMLMSVMKAPVEKLVRTLAEPTAKLVRTVAAVKAQKEAA